MAVRSPSSSLRGPARQGATVLGAGRRGPDHVEVALREHGQRLPTTNIGANGGLAFRVNIKADHLPAQLCEGWHPCQAGRPGRSRQRRPRSSRPAPGCTERTPGASAARPAPRRRAAHGCASDRPGRGANERPRWKVPPTQTNAVRRSTEAAAIVWEPSAYKDAAGDRVNVCLEASEEAVAAVEGWEAAVVKMAARRRSSGAIPVLLENMGPGHQVRQAQGHAGQRALLGQRGQAHLEFWQQCSSAIFM